MEHDMSSLEGSDDCIVSSLTMRHVQTSSESETSDMRPHVMPGHDILSFKMKTPLGIFLLPGESLQLNCLSQDGQELLELLSFLCVAQYVLFRELNTKTRFHDEGNSLYMWP